MHDEFLRWRGEPVGHLIFRRPLPFDVDGQGPVFCVLQTLGTIPNTVTLERILDRVFVLAIQRERPEPLNGRGLVLFETQDGALASVI